MVPSADSSVISMSSPRSRSRQRRAATKVRARSVVTEQLRLGEPKLVGDGAPDTVAAVEMAVADQRDVLAGYAKGAR
jgi:hypothetical protein